MANWCNNFLEYTTKRKPKWVTVKPNDDGAIPLPYDEHYAFGSDLECVGSNGKWVVVMHFQTKWAPPIEFYESLRHDPNTVSLYADYEECSSEIYGKFDMDGHEEHQHPADYYSNIIDQHILLEEPSQLYCDVVRDEYTLFSEYLLELKSKVCSNDVIMKEMEEELQACAKKLGVNLEDQQWQELIS